MNSKNEEKIIKKYISIILFIGYACIKSFFISSLNLFNNNHQLDHIIDKKSPILLDIGFGSGDFLYHISQKKT